MLDLKGKVAVVTGASSGLGRDAALAYAKEGANVALLARRKEKIDNVAKEIEALGVEALAVQCDVTNEEEVKSAIEAVVNKFGTIDILLNNAGVAIRGTVEELTERTEEDMMKVRNLGKKSLDEVKAKLEELGLGLKPSDD